MLEAFGVSAAVVALAEIGDKTQLLAIVLAVRYRKPVPILLGILAATLLNHAIAAWAGVLVARWIDGDWFQVAIGVGFIVMAAWALIPDKEDERAAESTGGRGVFLTTLIAFFLVEIGDKTQIATSLLAARFNDIVMVTAGTTFGMMLANVPAVFLGEAVTRVAPLACIRVATAVLFAILGAVVIWNALAG